MLEKEQWPPNNSRDLNGMEISCLGNDARSYFETFIRSPKTISELKIALGQFSAGPINKAVPSFTSSLTKVRER